MARPRAGLDFVHVNGMSGRFYMPEIMAPGVALFDYDNDGDLDLYLVQGQPLGPGAPASRARHAARPIASTATSCSVGRRRHPPRCASPTSPAQSGIGAARLRHGRGHGRLRQRRPAGPVRDAVRRAERSCCATTATARSPTSPKASGTDDRGLERVARRSSTSIATAGSTSSSATTCATRSKATRPAEPVGRAATTARPQLPAAARSALPQPRDGTFGDVATASRIARALRPGARRRRPPTSTTTAGSTSTSPTTARRTSSGSTGATARSRTTALLAGVALPLNGQGRGQHGRRRRRLRRRRRRGPGRSPTSPARATTCYVNDGSGRSRTHSARAGLGPASLPLHRLRRRAGSTTTTTAGSICWRSTAPCSDRGARRRGDPFPFHQRKLLFHNTGDGRFEDVTARAGAAFAASEVGRGVAFGDVDNDGDIDVAGRQQQRAGATAAATRRPPAATGSACGWSAGRRGGATCWARASRVKRAAGVSAPAARAPTAATPRPTIRACCRARRRRPARARRRRALARRAHRDVPGGGGRSLHHADAGDRPVTTRWPVV